MIFQVTAGFQDIVYVLDNLGLRDFILPFILLFTVMFAVLEKIKLFKNGRKYNSLIAFAISLIVIIPHLTGQYPPGSDVVEIINNALPGVALWVIIIVSFLILIGLFAPTNIPLLSMLYSNWIAIGAIVVVGYIFGASAGWWGRVEGIPYWLQDPKTQALIIIIAIFWFVISFITGTDKSKEEKQTERIADIDRAKTLRAKAKELEAEEEK